MSKKENTQEFNLEDILQEFGSADDTTDKSLSDADMAELAGEVGMSLEDFTTHVEVPQNVMPEEAAEVPAEEAAGDTMRLDDLHQIIPEESQEAEAADSTLRMDPIETASPEEIPEAAPAETPTAPSNSIPFSIITSVAPAVKSPRMAPPSRISPFFIVFPF